MLLTRTDHSSDSGNLSDPAAYMTTMEAAVYLGVSTALMERWRQLRIGPPYIRIGRSIRYRRSDVDEYMWQHRVKPMT